MNAGRRARIYSPAVEQPVSAPNISPKTHFTLRSARFRIASIGGSFFFAILALLAAVQPPSPSASSTATLAGDAGEWSLCVVAIVLGALSLRAGTIRLWPDRLTYHSVLRTETFPKSEIAAVGYAQKPTIRAWNGLYLDMKDGQRKWMKEFSSPPRGLPTRFGADDAREGSLLSEVRRWMADDA